MRPQRSLILVALLFVIVSIVTLLPRIQNSSSGVKEYIEHELTKEEIEGFFVDQDPTYVPLPSLELLWQPPMRNVRLRRGYTLWGTDCHMGPRAEFKSLFPKMGMNYTDRGIQTGYKLPQFYDRNNPPAWNVNLWKQIQKEFFEQHKDEEEFKKADGFMCSFDPHYCFLYLPFNKPIITAFAYRIEGHVMGPAEDARVFLEIVKEMDRHPEVVLGATNPYDAMYINHYTGSRRAADLTSLGDYMPHRYDPKGGLPIIIGPQRLSHGGNIIAESIQRASEGKTETFRTVHQLYGGGYAYETLCKHKAVVVLPYSIHSYGMLEMRKMNIPLIYPSPKLLATYEKDFHMIAERKTNLGQTSDGALVGHPRSLSGSFNPNNDYSLPDLEHWLKFADFYQWPVLTFDNITHLFHIAETVDFEAQSRKIAAFNKKLEQKIVKKWESVFYNVFGDIPPGERPIPSSYEEGMRIWKEKTQKPSWNFLPSKSASEGLHENWIVVTSINGPTDQVKTLAALPGWKVVVVGDKKTPKDWSWPNCIFLSVDQQKELGYRIFDLLPFDHYTRKNVGYLYAIQHGAKVIYDTDDDNVIAQKGIVSYPETTDELPLLQTKYHLLNPYGFFGKPTLWPRGFPLEEVRNRNVIPTNFTYEEVKIPIQQGLADYDPDVDAIHRLTNPLPVFFKNRQGAVYPKGVFSPFNSQNTLFHYSAFWGLLIPKTTTFRVCDIWRGYWAQRMLWEIGSNLCFLNATAVQVRNPHNYLDDFEDELDLYLSGGKLVKYLKQWVPEATENLFDMIYQLHQDLAAGGFWERREAELTKAWLLDLIDVGYKIPPLRSSS